MTKAFPGDPAVSDILSVYTLREQESELNGFNNLVAICLIHPQSDNAQKN